MTQAASCAHRPMEAGKGAGFRARLVRIFRVFGLALVLFVLSCVATAPRAPMNAPANALTCAFDTPIDHVAGLVSDAHALPGKTEELPGRLPDHLPKDMLKDMEVRILELLTPVFGADHVVVRASFAPSTVLPKPLPHGAGGEGGAQDQETGQETMSPDAQGRDGTICSRPPVSVAVIVDTSNLAGFPGSPEGLRAEEERLSMLIVRAAGLDTAHGDLIQASFWRFTEKSEAASTILAAAAGLVLLVFVSVALVLAYGRNERRKNDASDEKLVEKSVKNMTDSLAKQDFRTALEGAGTALSCEKQPVEDAAGSRKDLARLADRLRVERPQARAVALSLLEPGDAACALCSLPCGLQAETLACMILQEPVEDEVLNLVERMFLDGLELAKERERDPVARSLKVLDALDAMDAALDTPDGERAQEASLSTRKTRLLAEIASLSPEAGRVLEAARG